MTDEVYIWIAKWKQFQHYKPDPERGPKWIKDYTAQLDDTRYLDLTDRQRALLRDIRDVFATYRGRLPYDTRTITRERHSQTRDADLKALNHAGFLDIISRETLEQRLEEFYSGSSAEVEVEVEKEQTLLPSEPNYAGPTLVAAERATKSFFQIPTKATAEEGRK